MNAILRDNCEAILLTNEAIEVHLSYLRPAVEALGNKLDQLNQKVDDRLERVDEKLDQLNKKIDDGLGRLDKKIDDGLGRLDKKIDDGLGQVNKEIRQVHQKFDNQFDELNKKIDLNDKQHIERALRIQGSVDGLKWFVSSAALLASGISIAHSFGWI